MSHTTLGMALYFAAALACSGCGASTQRILGQPVRRPVSIVVHISDQVNTSDQAGGVAELVEAIGAGLKEHGMPSQIYTAANEHPSPPRVELDVVYWSERSTTSRQLGAARAVAPGLGIASAMVGPSNRIVVDCAVFLDDGRRAFWRRFDTGPGLRMGDPDEAAAGDEAGKLILRQLLKD
jgi:hypothetical protein